MPQLPSSEDMRDILAMLGEVKMICLNATVAVNKHKGDRAFAYEGVPELVRAQLQNAVSLCVQAETIWTITLQEWEKLNGKQG